jgi:hypothetical protein
MRSLILTLALGLAASAPAFAAGNGVTPVSPPGPYRPALNIKNFSAIASIGKNCTPGSLGYTYFYGPYGEPEKKDNCTGQISSNY